MGQIFCPGPPVLAATRLSARFLLSYYMESSDDPAALFYGWRNECELPIAAVKRLDRKFVRTAIYVFEPNRIRLPRLIHYVAKLIPGIDKSIPEWLSEFGEKRNTCD